MALTKLKQRRISLLFLYEYVENISISFITCQPAETISLVYFSTLTSLPFCIFFFPFKLTVHSHLELHYAFLPKFTRHIDNRTCTESPTTPPRPTTTSVFEVLEVSYPLLSPCLFLPPPIWSLTPSPHLCEGVNEGRGHPSSLPPLPLNWLLVASVDSCRHLSPPLLWRASEQTSCSFVAFLSLQPQACLPTESKRETLIINSAEVIAGTTPICCLQHAHAILFNPFQ